MHVATVIAIQLETVALVVFFFRFHPPHSLISADHPDKNTIVYLAIVNMDAMLRLSMF